MSVPDSKIEGAYRLLSASRLSPYMDIAASDKRLAIQLHAWNAALAAALMPVLQITEVTIRNLAMIRIEANVPSNLNGQWWLNPDLLAKLGKKQADELTACVSKIKARMASLNVANVSGYTLRDLPFGFWVTFYSDAFQSTFWKRDLHTYLLPSRSRPRTLTIEQLHARIEDIRDLRNKVAHHRNLIAKATPTIKDHHDSTLTTLRWLHPEAADHAEVITTFPLVWNACPLPHDELRERLAYRGALAVRSEKTARSSAGTSNGPKPSIRPPRNQSTITMSKDGAAQLPAKEPEQAGVGKAKDATGE